MKLPLQLLLLRGSVQQAHPLWRRVPRSVWRCRHSHPMLPLDLILILILSQSVESIEIRCRFQPPGGLRARSNGHEQGRGCPCPRFR